MSIAMLFQDGLTSCTTSCRIAFWIGEARRSAPMAWQLRWATRMASQMFSETHGGQAKNLLSRYGDHWHILSKNDTWVAVCVRPWGRNYFTAGKAKVRAPPWLAGGLCF